VQLLPVLNNSSAGNSNQISAFNESVLAIATPGRKRKDWVDAGTLTPSQASPEALLIRHSSSDDQGSDGEDELVIILSQDSQDLTDEAWLASIASQWDLVVALLNRLSSDFKKLKYTIGGDMEILQIKLIMTETCLGSIPPRLGFGNCISAWDGLALLQGKSDLAV